ncbi:MAG: M28 family peptidase, partial [Gammaproteobacteria bacterium]
MRRWRKLHSALIVIALWCVAFGSCYRLLTPPDLGARLTVSPAYSVNTALAHLKHIAAEPHPLGSKAHQRVAGYLLEQLNHLGYQADVQETIAVSPRDDTDRSGREQVLKVAWVKNIAVRIPGSDSRGAVLIAGHYDSVDSSFGAADNGAAVASMLEVLRLLKNSPPPKNDM